ncbi:MAG: major facilitator superfamily 1 [Frankiales bacterium]|nr:major facilitator superfamily 1 [Frankiales bacterium]
MISRVGDAVAPARLGRDFRRLLASTWISNLGDGLGVAAAPLLVASETRSAFLVSMAAFLRGLPWLLFGLVAGAVADRVDRKRLVAAVDLVRVVVLALLAVSVGTGTVSVALVLAAVFVLGVAEVFADTGGQTLLPMVVEREDLPLGNARLYAGSVGANQLLGPPLGAALFTAGRVWPFLTQGLLVAAGVWLMLRITTSTVPGERRETHLGADIAEGLRWTWSHAAVRTLVLTIFAFNLTFGAAWSVLVLWARERLGLDEVGYGVLLAVCAAGSLIGAAVYGPITRRLRLSTLMRVGLVLETLTHLAFAVTTDAWVAMAVMLLFGAHAMVWGTTSTSIRQQAVPDELQGRVSGVNMVGTWGTIVVGSLVGGALAEGWGVTAPFWFAFVGSALFVVLLWRQLAHVSHEQSHGAAPTSLDAR